MSDALRRTLEQLLDGHNLSEEAAGMLLESLVDESLDPAIGAAVLAALRTKGETPEEVRGFARTMRRLARRPDIEDTSSAIDIVGTGGDGSSSLNLSTGAALLTAACGVPVVKHGNRSISSKSGSADVLERLGMPMPLDEAAAASSLDRTGFTFLFAPHYHPAMKALAPIRRALGVRTVFNVLGPLTNPAQPAYHSLGAFSATTAELMAKTLAGLPGRCGAVVHGDPGWDEATPVGQWIQFDVVEGAVSKRVREPEEFGLARCRPEDLRGADPESNAQRLANVLRGREHGPHRDAILLGCAIALEICEQAQSAQDAIAQSRAAIADGRAAQLVDALAETRK